MELVIWTLVGFLSGSIPYSVWVGKFVRGLDIRRFGDHNPGAANVLRSVGWRWAVLALLLDSLKAALPVGCAWFSGDVHGLGIIPVALAPVLGHAFSPWLKFQGGKAVAATFGVWGGLTLGAGPTVLGLLLGLLFAVFTVDGWAVVLSLFCFGGFLFLAYPSNPQFLTIWLGLLVVLAWKHRRDLRCLPGIRPGLLKWLRRLE